MVAFPDRAPPCLKCVHFFVTFNYGLMVFSSGNFPVALEQFNKAASELSIPDDKNKFLVKRWIGRTLQKVGRLDDAESELNAVKDFFAEKSWRFQANLHSLRILLGEDLFLRQRRY